MLKSLVIIENPDMPPIPAGMLIGVCRRETEGRPAGGCDKDVKIGGYAGRKQKAAPRGGAPDLLAGPAL